MHNTPRQKHTVLLRIPVLWLGLVGFSLHAFAITEADSPAQDQRQVKLEAFFHSFGCPAPLHVSEYLGAADTYAIDYRLLPAISVLESTCGVHQRLNNRWGWDSARRGFSSFRAGLEYIARQLSEGRYYKNKTLEEKVRMYNPNPQYARQIKKLMRKIDDGRVASFHDSVAECKANGQDQGWGKGPAHRANCEESAFLLN